MGQRLSGKAGILIAAVAAVLIVAILTGIGVVVTVRAQSGNEVIHACTGGNGNLRAVDSADECRNNETALEWNVQGPQGPQGDKGDTGEPASLDWANVTNKPAGFADDVDDDTQLTEAQVEGFITNSALDLAAGTTLNSDAISTGVHTSSLPWGSITDIPEGFSDGVDNDSLGDLSCDTEQLARWNGATWECFWDGPTITKYHAPGINGEFTSMAIGSDNLPLISYYDDENRKIKVAHCQNTACTSANTRTVDSIASDVSRPNSTSITIGGDGLGLVAYVVQEGAAKTPTLKVAHCENVECSTVTVSAVDSFVGSINTKSSIVTGSDGLGLISYVTTGGNPEKVRVAKCGDAACTSATLSTIVSAPINDDNAVIAIGSDGFGLVSYEVGGGEPEGGLKITHCENLTCTSFSTSTLALGATVGGIAVGTDGKALITFVKGQALHVAHCNDVACNTAGITRLNDGSTSNPSIVIGADELPIISFTSNSGQLSLALAHCENAACTDAVLSLVDNEVKVGEFSSIAIGADDLPIISYYDGFRVDLKVAHCPDPVTCAPE